MSRQLWWGHRIPAYFACTKAEEGTLDVNANDLKDRWVVARSEAAARTKVRQGMGQGRGGVCEVRACVRACACVCVCVWMAVT